MPMTLAERAEHIYYAERDEAYRRDLVKLAAKDVCFHLNLFGWTFDPRLDGEGRFLPLLLFPQQEDFAYQFSEAIDRGGDLLVEKSRDTGASWTALGVIHHKWYYQKMFTALIGSRKEDLVDRAGSTETLFWKLDQLYENLPDWMKIPGYRNDKPTRIHMMMLNPLMGSVITGESANPNFGRQGRYSTCLFDEGAFWPNLRASYTSAGESTRCRALISTPNGMNFFGRLANPKKKDKLVSKYARALRKIRLHWSLDPRHNVTLIDEDPESPTFGKEINPWLEGQKARYNYDVEQMAQELDIDYRASIKGRYYPQVDFVRLGEYEYDPNLPLYSAWDFGKGDGTAILWAQFDATELRWRIIDAYYAKGKHISFFVPFITGILPGDFAGETYTREDLAIIRRHRGWVYKGHFGDPSGEQESQAADMSVIDELAMERIYVTINYKENTHIKRRRATQRLLLRLDCDEERTMDFVDAIRNSKFPERNEGTESTTPNWRPVHDEYSHFRTALEFLAVNNPHRFDTQETTRGMMAKGKTVGATFGGKLTADVVALMQEMGHELEETDFDDIFGDRHPSASSSAAGY